MPEAAEIAEAFRGRTRGAVRTDLVSRRLYATDASPYEILPAAVLVAEEPDDVAAAVEICRGLGLPITARGAGTSLSGQCVGEGLQLDCSGLNEVEWIDAERRIARVGPGATWWELDRRAAAHGLEFGPDPATRRQCTAGGMIGTNAGGTHSIVAGATVDHVHAVEAVLADGSRVRFRASDDGSVAGGGAPPALASALEAVRVGAEPLLGPSFRTLARRCSGYQLEHLCAARPHLGKLLGGSDGTLGLTVGAEVTLDARPAHRVLALVAFDDLHSALACVPGLVETGPCAVEVVSRSLLDVARRDPVHARAVSDVDADAGAFLFVEYQGASEAEAAAGFVRMDGAVAGARERLRFTDPAACARVWAVREAGIGSLAAVASGPRLPQAFVEDTVVAVDRLPGYIRELDALFGAHGMDVVWYGHASTGLVHVRPFLDMTSASDLARLESLMAAAVDLVRAWGGDLSGEHGDGLARSYWNERLFGPEVYAQLRAVKAAFDPANLLNPGKVVDGPHPTSNLRYGPGYARRHPPVRVGFADQDGFAGAAERCFGAGVCRKRGPGTMCPPAMATGLEEHSTRARANLLRSVVAGTLRLDDLRADEAREVMETCVACKACKTECPARVDMARMKAAWTDLVRRRDGGDVLGWSIAHLRTLSGLGSSVAPLANAILGSRRVRRRLGIAAERRLPSLDPVPLTKRLPTADGNVLVYPDCFTTYQEPGIGDAAAALVRASGREPALAPVGCCGRVALSEGYADVARAAAARAAAALRRTTTPLLYCEPSCLSMVADDWPHLIGDVSDIVRRSQLAWDWVAGRAGVALRGGGRVVVHPHCHERALWGPGALERALALVEGLDVTVLDAGCCGMAGAFGYRAERYGLSKAIASRALVPAIEAAGDAEVLASGTSCRHQIADFTGRTAVHPLAFLAARLA